VGVSFGAGVTCWISCAITEGCGAVFVGAVVVEEGFSKEANSASKSLSGEGFLGVSLGVVGTGVGVCIGCEEAGSATGAVVESDDHHQPMICYEYVCCEKKL